MWLWNPLSLWQISSSEDRCCFFEITSKQHSWRPRVSHCKRNVLELNRKKVSMEHKNIARFESLLANPIPFCHMESWGKHATRVGQRTQRAHRLTSLSKARRDGRRASGKSYHQEPDIFKTCVIYIFLTRFASSSTFFMQNRECRCVRPQYQLLRNLKSFESFWNSRSKTVEFVINLEI